MNTRFIPLVADVATTPTPPVVRPAPLVPAPSDATSTLAAPTSSSKPQVEIRREGERVTTIFIRCTCGEQIELRCEA